MNNTGNFGDLGIDGNNGIKTVLEGILNEDVEWIRLSQDKVQ
jgi:hypothetical protein